MAPPETITGMTYTLSRSRQDPKPRISPAPLNRAQSPPIPPPKRYKSPGLISQSSKSSLAESMTFTFPPPPVPTLRITTEMMREAKRPRTPELETVVRPTTPNASPTKRTKTRMTEPHERQCTRCLACSMRAGSMSSVSASSSSTSLSAVTAASSVSPASQKEKAEPMLRKTPSEDTLRASRNLSRAVESTQPPQRAASATGYRATRPAVRTASTRSLRSLLTRKEVEPRPSIDKASISEPLEKAHPFGGPNATRWGIRVSWLVQQTANDAAVSAEQDCNTSIHTRATTPTIRSPSATGARLPRIAASPPSVIPSLPSRISASFAKTFIRQPPPVPQDNDTPMPDYVPRSLTATSGTMSEQVAAMNPRLTAKKAPSKFTWLPPIRTPRLTQNEAMSDRLRQAMNRGHQATMQDRAQRAGPQVLSPSRVPPRPTHPLETTPTHARVRRDSGSFEDPEVEQHGHSARSRPAMPWDEPRYPPSRVAVHTSPQGSVDNSGSVWYDSDDERDHPSGNNLSRMMERIRPQRKRRQPRSDSRMGILERADTPMSMSTAAHRAQYQPWQDPCRCEGDVIGGLNGIALHSEGGSSRLVGRLVAFARSKLRAYRSAREERSILKAQARAGRGSNGAFALCG